jgi:hypothetical protein
MSTKYADNPQTESARKALSEEKKVVEKSRSEFAERMKGKPTPTQEELDMSALGANILEHEDDGSGPDPNASSRSMEADRKPAQSYQTRQHAAAHKAE